MAIISSPVTTELILVMDGGLGVSGNPLTKNRVYKNVKPDADHADVYAVAQAMLNLQNKTNTAVQVRNVAELQSK